MVGPKKTVATESPEWVNLPHELYAKACAELVTFSHKTGNSNAPPGGIRLSPAQALKLPYVSARTLLGASQAPTLDYVANAGKTATVVKQLHQLLAGSATAPADEAQHLLTTFAAATAQGTQLGVDKISLRARQLLLPRQGSYVSVTPLSAGGISRKIREAVRTHNTRLRETPNDRQQPIRLAKFGLGGANPQNVGALVRDMQRPLVFFAPTENRQLKTTLALHFQGIAIRLPYPLLHEFRAWCANCRRRNGGLIPTNMHTRDEEIEHIRAITAAILDQGAAARLQLLAHQDMLPAGGIPLVAAEADPVNRGLIDPQLRTKNWPNAFAARLATLIADHRFGDGHEEFLFEQADIFEMQAMIVEVAR